MLEISDLNVNFKSNHVLKSLNLRADKGEIIGLLGKNGAGKTTLFEALFQSIKYDGEIVWENEKITRGRVSYLETDNYFYPYITGREYLSYFSVANGSELVQKFNLPLDKFVHEYSSGMKKKLAFIGMLLLDKPINILDEPFNGVDFEGVHILYDVIRQLRTQEKVVLISSHIIETLFHTCDKIAILENGKVERIYNKVEFKDLQSFKF